MSENGEKLEAIADAALEGDVLEAGDEPAGDDDELEGSGVDWARVAGWAAVFGLVLIGAAILARRATVVRPVRLPVDELAAEYREGYDAGIADARREGQLEDELAARTAWPVPEPVIVDPQNVPGPVRPIVTPPGPVLVTVEPSDEPAPAIPGELSDDELEKLAATRAAWAELREGPRQTVE